MGTYMNLNYRNVKDELRDFIKEWSWYGNWVIEAESNVYGYEVGVVGWGPSPEKEMVNSEAK